MAVCTVNFWGESLQKECSMNLILPGRVKTRKRPCVLYQLHGLSDDYTAWLRRTSIDRYVSELPLIVVMPDGGRSFYCDAVEGPAYEKHIMKDVIGFVERFLNVREGRRGRAIGGLSMGGYGAMKLALKYPRMFTSVVSHSSAFGFAHDPRMLENEERRRISPAAKTISSPLPQSSRRGKPPPFASTVGKTTHCLEATASFTATSCGSRSSTNTANAPENTTGPTGTSTSSKPSASTPSI